ncbi:glycerol kinase GlpK [Helicobacter mehlei]|uniref:Glycerol kinase n=1 Tax=Helicobacter mehlei TaxID=2316080 RepID=A0A553V0Q8_9HELI|nr:glycerol kinase GlpK [Helicobacter mehlei]TSA85801.1 glycerol kinase GlpK [Helicobacter mehlei]
MDHYIMALDQGTTSSRTLIFDKQGRVISMAQKPFSQFFPKPGWVEHDPKEIWATQIATLTEALAKANLDAKNIAALGITNQRETTVLWDRYTGEPIYNAIVWQDHRTADVCEKLKKTHKEMIQAKTGLVIDAYFSATKIAWILDHVKGARQKAQQGDLCFGTIDTWLLYNLTKRRVHFTDPSNASRTMLFNIHTLEWDRQLLALFGIPKEILPEVKSSSEIYGHTATRWVECEIPIAGMAGDQQAALFGQMCVEPGMVKNTYGTGCFLLMQTGQQSVTSQNNLLSTIAWKIGGKVSYALEGGVFVGGAAIQWLRDGARMIRTAADIQNLASTVEDNGGVYIVPALTGLGAPYWDQYARGSIFGVSRGSTDGHIARAILEGIAFQVHDIIKEMEKDAGRSCSQIRVDGGASACNLLMQIQADVCNTNIIRPQNVETTAMGAGYLAGLAVGFYEDLEQIQQLWHTDQQFSPKLEPHKLQEMLYFWQKAVQASKNWLL